MDKKIAVKLTFRQILELCTIDNKLKYKFISIVSDIDIRRANELPPKRTY